MFAIKLLYFLVRNERISPDYLQEVDLPIVSWDSCEQVYRNISGFNKAKVICAGYEEGGKDTCKGRSS